MVTNCQIVTIIFLVVMPTIFYKGGLYDAPCDKELFSPSKKEYEEKFYSEIK